MDTDQLAWEYLASAIKRFENLKELGDKAMAQLSDGDLQYQPDPGSNNIAIIIQHLHGNMLSRWTDFLTSDGEKPTRDRDGEFEAKALDRAELLRRWEEGWACLFNALQPLDEGDLLRTITIRGQGLIAIDAINRQLTHYGYHIGQLVYLARMRRGPAWQTLSIAKGQSKSYEPKPQD